MQQISADGEERKTKKSNAAADLGNGDACMFLEDAGGLVEYPVTFIAGT